MIKNNHKKLKEFYVFYLFILLFVIQINAVGLQSQIPIVQNYDIQTSGQTTEKATSTLSINKKLDSTQQIHTGIIGSIAVSPDGSKVASDSVDRTIKIWDTNSHNVLKTIEIPSNYTTDTIYSLYHETSDPYTQHSILFSNDGSKVLISLQENNSATIDLVQFNVSSGLELKAFPIASKFLFNAPDNDNVFVRTSYGMLSYNLTSGNFTSVPLKLSFGASPNFILFTGNSSPQPNSLIYDEYSQCPTANLCNRGTIHIGQNITITGAHKNHIYTGALNQNQTMLTTVDSSRINFWDLTNCTSTNCTLIKSLPAYFSIRYGIDDTEKVVISISPDNSIMLLSILEQSTQKNSISVDYLNTNNYGSGLTGFSGLFIPNGNGAFVYYNNESVLFSKETNLLVPSSSSSSSNLGPSLSSNSPTLNSKTTTFITGDEVFYAFILLIFLKKRRNLF